MKAEARAYELAVQAAIDWRAGLVHFFAFDSALKAYGARRAVEAEIAALRKAGCFNDMPGTNGAKLIGLPPGNPHNSICRGGWLCPIHIALADAEQREKEMG